MNDQFLYELREPPPVAFAKRLESRLGHQQRYPKARIFNYLLASLLCGTAFAFFYKHSALQTTHTVDVPARPAQGGIARDIASAPQQRQMEAFPRSPAGPQQAQENAPTSTQSNAPPTSPQSHLVPAHWRMADLRGLPTSEGDYEFRSDFENVWNGSSSAFLRVMDKRARNFAVPDAADATCVVQAVQAMAFRGKRVEVTAHLKTDATSRAGMVLWTYTNNGPFQGLNTGPAPRSPWTAVSIVMEVPTNATSVLYGGCLQGNGSMWIDDVSFKEVDLTVPITAIPTLGLPAGTGRAKNFLPDALLQEPTNLDFENTVDWTPDFIWEVYRKPVSSFALH